MKTVKDSIQTITSFVLLADGQELGQQPRECGANRTAWCLVSVAKVQGLLRLNEVGYAR